MCTRAYIYVATRKETKKKKIRFDINLCPIPVVEHDSGRMDYILYNTDNFKESDPIEKPYIGIYSSADGYPTGAGKALVSHFDTYEKALNLVAGGIVSSVVSERVVYNRDLTSSFLKEEKRSIVQDDKPSRCEAYQYLFYKGRWYVRNGHSYWYDVKQVLDAFGDIDYIGETETDETFENLPEWNDLIPWHDNMTEKEKSDYDAAYERYYEAYENTLPTKGNVRTLRVEKAMNDPRKQPV